MATLRRGGRLCIRSMKDEFTRRVMLPWKHPATLNLLKRHADWFSQFRPHIALAGATTNEAYERKRPANRRPRFEPRPR